MKIKLAAVLVCAVMLGTLSGCTGGGGTTPTQTPDKTENTGNTDNTGGDTTAEGDGYTYGVDVTFHSDEPISYSIMYSDHENYPSMDNWLLWRAIEERTNVKFDLTLVARTDYDDKVSALVNAGDAPYIVPKIYQEGSYVPSGQVVAISDYVQYMPNYMKAYEDWGMEADLKEMLQEDGKYYRLPGMWERAAGGYSLLIRKDIFEAAGINVEEAEKTWTWETFAEDLKKVKEYTGTEYVWSDQYQGASTMNIAGVTYGVRAGRGSDGGDWGLRNGTLFDRTKEEFFFSNTTDAYRDMLSVFSKMYDEKLVDPETYIQDAETALSKFYRGESFVINANYQTLADINGTGKMQVEGAEIYMIVPPGGPKGQIQPESTRLENGIMISKSALDELGEEGFIKMLRFVDWLWYSNEGQTLSLWGVEGETYEMVGNKPVLNSDIYYNGMNEGAEKKLNVDFGFGGGVFAYGGSSELRFSKFTEGEVDYNNRVYANKTAREIDVPIMSNEFEREDLNLIETPLMDYVSASTLEFITGRKSLDTDWDAYVAECELKGSVKYIDMVNDIYERTKDILK